MSAFSGLTFGVTLRSTDQSQGGFRSFLSGFNTVVRTAAKPITVPLQIARGGLGLLRDINLGLAPVVRGLDDLIERGAGLEVVRKSFESLTGRSGRDAERLAKSIVNAASGTLRMAEAMQIANRALGSGLSLEQLGTAIEFIGKKAITTGKNASEALNTVITGLARGSTLFLDDFGILVDGVDGVRASFDKIKGSGAFDSMGPAAQKAETIRQAIAEMQGQMSKIGVTGGETIFVWQGIKNQVGDAVDKLVLAVAGSKAMRDSLLGFRDILGGISEHFAKGGGFMEILSGKGASGGLLGLIGGALSDAGSAIGRGLTGALLIGAAKVGEGIESLWDKIKAQVPGTFGPVFTEVTGTMVHLPTALGEQFDSFINMLKDAFKTIVGWFDQSFDFLAEWIQKIPGFKPDPVATTQPAGPPPEPALLRLGRGVARVGSGVARGAYNLYRAQYGGSYEQASLDYYNQARNGSANYYMPLNQQLGIAHAVMMMMHGTPDGGGKSSIWESLRGAGKDLFSGGVYGGDSEFNKALAGFRGEFAAATPPADGDAPVLGEMGGDAFRFTLSERIRRRREIGVLKARGRNIGRGGEFARQEARRLAGADIRGLVRGGRHLSNADREEIFQARLRESIERRARPVREGIEERENALARADKADPAARRRANEWKQGDELMRVVRELLTQISALIGTLGGENQKLAALARG